MEDDAHVVLDQHDRQLRLPVQAADQPGDVVGFLIAHPGGRLVEQQKPRTQRQRHHDLRRPLVAVRQRADANVRLVREAAKRQQFRDPLLDPGPRRAAEPGPQPLAGGDLDGDAQVLGDAQLGKDLGDLEGSRHAARDPPLRRKRRDVPPVEQDAPRASAGRSR